MFGFAQQQPQWMMAVYFETGDGQKDTVYFGYDPSASASSQVIDEQFMELEQSTEHDPTKFNAYVGESSNSHPYRKANITNNFQEKNIYFSGTGTFPVTMKWENTKLYSSNLPNDIFPAILDRPRARLDIYPEVGCYPSCVDNCSFVCTDSLYQELHSYFIDVYMEIFVDSVCFGIYEEPYPISGYENIRITINPFNTIVNWSNNYNSKQEVSNKIKLSPNPATEIINLTNLPQKPLNIIIYNIQGKEILTETSSSKTTVQINISNLEKGIYTLKMTDTYHQNLYFEKIIKY